MHDHDYSCPLEAHYIRRLRATYRLRARRVAAIRTPAEASRYQEQVRQALAGAFGPLPARTPLQPRLWRTTERAGFRIEHVTFESRPGFMVSANLYLPGTDGCPAPGVIFPCGHSSTGKAHPLYVDACIRLVRQGYAVLIYDPLNQGERDLYAHLDTGGRLTRNNPCGGHNVIGRQLHACGEWLGTWRLWDGLRATDYLSGRPEVDPAQLAVTGQSGGGTLSALLWAMEPRFRAVASSCWCTSYLNDLENAMPADEEQYPPGFLAAGMDKIDCFLVRAGQPALLLGQEQDFFDDRGLRRGFEELARLHGLLGGAGAECRLAMDTGTHAYSPSNQLAMLEFFNRVFGRHPVATPEPLPVLDEAALQVTPENDVGRAGSRPMPDLVAERAQAVAAARPTVPARRLAGVVRRILGVPASCTVPHHRRWFQTAARHPASGLPVYRFGVETEADILCVLRHAGETATAFRLSPAREVTLHVTDVDSRQELDALLPPAPGEDLWIVDPRGLGESLFSAGDVYDLYGHDYLAAGHAVLYRETLLGGRLRDVLSVVRLLRAEGAATIRVSGRRQGGILALLAALLDDGIAGVRCVETPESFLALATAPFTFWPAVNFPHGVLAAFDLPEVRRTLGGRLLADSRTSPRAFDC